MSQVDSQQGIGSRIRQAILSYSGAAIFIGVLGFLSGISGLFVDLNSQLSVKWLLFSALISITLIVILLNLLAVKPTTIERPAPFDEVPIQIRGESLLIVKRNPYLSNLIVVAGYRRDAEFEDLAFIGTVSHIQEKAVQVQIDKVYNDFVPSLHFRDIVVRPVVPKQFILELLEAAQSAAADYQDPLAATPAAYAAPAATPGESQ